MILENELNCHRFIVIIEGKLFDSNYLLCEFVKLHVKFVERATDKR